MVADVADVKVIVMYPSFPADDGRPLYAQEMHWPKENLSRDDVKTFPLSGPEAKYHCGSPFGLYE
jgi:hypothetical protein